MCACINKYVFSLLNGVKQGGGSDSYFVYNVYCWNVDSFEDCENGMLFQLYFIMGALSYADDITLLCDINLNWKKKCMYEMSKNMNVFRN